MMVGGGALAANPLPVAPGRIGMALQRGAYTWAVAIAHAKSRISPDMLMDRLEITPGSARQIISRLEADGVVSAPDATGMSRLSESLLRVTSDVVSRGPDGGMVARRSLKDLSEQLLQRARKAAGAPPDAHDAGDMRQITEATDSPDQDISLSDDDPGPQEASA